MSEVLTGGLPEPDQPFTWARQDGGVIYTTHGPVQPDGSILDGPIEAQAELTLRNLQAVLDEAGATMQQVTLVHLFLLSVEDMAPVDRIYKEFFTPPYPNRASLVVAGLVAPKMRIELTAIIHLNK
jgi:enamine deaminase RidA (YjgF/YER057c/UK114 family)